MRKKNSQSNVIVSVVIALAALAYFAYQSRISAPAGPEGKSIPVNEAPSTAKAPVTGEAQPVPADVQRGLPQVLAPVTLTPEERKARGIPEDLPDDMVRALVSPPPELPPDMKAQLNAPAPELPDDLKRQLQAPPPELPDDLKAQLNAPPPPLPDDIKQALATPPRTVTLEEVNTPPPADQ